MDSNRRVLFQFEQWSNALIPEMGRSALENPNIPLQFLQDETFAFLWVFFPGAVRLRVKIGFMPFARGQHKAAIDDLPADRIENHDPLVAATGSERSLFPARRLPSIVQGQHASGILAAVAQDGVTPGRIGWRGRRGTLLRCEVGGRGVCALFSERFVFLRRVMYRGQPECLALRPAGNECRTGPFREFENCLAGAAGEFEALVAGQAPRIDGGEDRKRPKAG